MRFFPTSLAFLLLSFAATIHAQIQTSVLAEWTFENDPAPLAVIGSMVGPIPADTGDGELRGFHASANTTWNTTQVGNGSPRALSANRWASGDYFEFRVPFIPGGEITVSWDQFRSSTAPGQFALQLSTNGSTFETLKTYSVGNSSWSAYSTDPAAAFSHPLENPVPDNTTHLTFRLTAATNATNTAGTSRIDNIRVARTANRYLLNLNGREIEVVRWGTGPKGVLFFSHSGNLAMDFQTNSDLVRELAGTGYSVFVWSYPWDMAPFNAVQQTLSNWISGQLPAENRLLFPGVASSLLDQLRQATGIEKFVLAGNSLGAGVILSDYAVLAQDPDCKLLLISPTEPFIPLALPQKLEKTVMVADPGNDFWLRRQADKDFCSLNSNAPFPYPSPPGHIILSGAFGIRYAFDLVEMAHADPGFAVLTAPQGGFFMEPGAWLHVGWYADFPAGPLAVDLLKAGQPVAAISNSTANSGNFFWKIPTDLEAGTDYSVRVRSLSDPGKTVVGESPFAIAHFLIFPPANSTTLDGTFPLQGWMGGSLWKGLSWTNRSTGQSGTVSLANLWTAQIPLAHGSNFIDFRAGVYEMNERAFDYPWHSAYSTDWFDGSNGGTGFGAWELARINHGWAGHVLFEPGVFNVPERFGGAFSLWAAGDSISTARRDFSRPLTPADTFTLQFDNNWIEAGKSVGFALADSAGTKRMEFFFVGYENNYRVRDAAGERLTDLGYTDQGLDISIRITESDGYILTAGNWSVSGTLAAGGPPSRLIATNNGSGYGTAFDVYLGQIQISDSSGVWASDSPADPAYRGGWSNGSRGGAGFGPWVLEKTGFDGRAGHVRFGTGTPNVPIWFGGALSLWANGTGISTAARPFLQPLAANDTFILQFDTNLVETGKKVGFALLDESGSPRFEFTYTGGDSTYQVNDAIPARNTAIPYTQDGLELRFELDSENTYRLWSNGNMALNGHLAPGGPIRRFLATNNGSGPGTPYDLFLGSMSVESQILLREVSASAPVIVRQVDPLQATDGLPNEWWTQYFGAIPPVPASADTDGDGFSNGQEFLLGTHPLDRSSAFRLQPPVLSSGKVLVEWDAVAGKTYQLYGSSTLSPADWQPVGERVTAPTTGRHAIEHDRGGRGRGFYRVQLVP